MKKSFWKLNLFFAGFAAIGLLASSCSKDDDNDKAIAPVAKFSQTSEDLTVTFTNTSTNAKTYAWDFDDGNVSTDKNPVHVYEEEGTYSVKLTVKGDGGEDSFSMDVEVSAGGNGGSGAAIVVDGDFSDWVEVPEEILFSAAIDEELTTLKVLKEVKVTSDAMYIFLYFKMDTEHANAMDIYINNDLDIETGYNGWMWKEHASDYLIQGFFADNYDMRLAGYDESADGGWGWLEPDIVAPGSGLMEISEMKTVSGTIVEFEAKIIRDFIPELGSEIRISFSHSGIEGEIWGTSGALPMVPAEGDANLGLLVTLQ